MSQQDMPYQLTTPNGKIVKFYLEGMARLYQKIWGGTVINTIQNKRAA